MKKIIVGTLLSVFSSVVLADDLKCENSYSIFREMTQQRIDIEQSGTAKQYKEYLEKTDYSYLFKNNHPNQIYWAKRWNDVESFIKASSSSIQKIQSEGYKNYYFKMGKPKANFISALGEMCTVPLISKDYFKGIDVYSTFDVVYVRDLKTNEWRKFMYYGVEDRQYLREFFSNDLRRLNLSMGILNGMAYDDFINDMAHKELEKEKIEKEH
ncbi:hypothetical protein [Acinetobacter gerneri]|uniref:Uncharacterized protein n=1 Tax=Acinetobacter gerneri DSM 14967 = CIP 107464 = MTCC 9824 TaxID=1120926 RepID=N8Y7I2_9GAMM|nr:hypothetical protein [Acinetobacter gerneri]ENV32732.1 hypothetical protein F960_02907 [Acinetobacter gerneri DSM 14967 = CIP 107464 = MTCC 9824]EPR83914.1 hypothetical protein L289_1838 [Acinetobacter gerneri DSM 14967 = CIP 107464 = MTCC 9824]